MRVSLAAAASLLLVTALLDLQVSAERHHG